MKIMKENTLRGESRRIGKIKTGNRSSSRNIETYFSIENKTQARAGEMVRTGCVLTADRPSRQLKLQIPGGLGVNGLETKEVGLGKEMGTNFQNLYEGVNKISTVTAPPTKSTNQITKPEEESQDPATKLPEDLGEEPTET